MPTTSPSSRRDGRGPETLTVTRRRSVRSSNTTRLPSAKAGAPARASPAASSTTKIGTKVPGERTVDDVEGAGGAAPTPVVVVLPGTVAEDGDVVGVVPCAPPG